MTARRNLFPVPSRSFTSAQYQHADEKSGDDVQPKGLDGQYQKEGCGETVDHYAWVVFGRRGEPTSIRHTSGCRQATSARTGLSCLLACLTGHTRGLTNRGCGRGWWWTGGLAFDNAERRPHPYCLLTFTRNRKYEQITGRLSRRLSGIIAVPDC